MSQIFGLRRPMVSLLKAYTVSSFVLGSTSLPAPLDRSRRGYRFQDPTRNLTLVKNEH